MIYGFFHSNEHSYDNIPKGCEIMTDEKSSTGLDRNIAALLCYIASFISGIAFLALEKNSPFVRFHAAQSTVTFIGLFIATIIASYIPLIGGLIRTLISIVSLLLWALLMYKSYQGERYKLPIAGDIAENLITNKNS